MKLIYLLLFLFIVNCSNGKKVYWCGDHPCINKAEQRSYFKKNMIVEVREIKKKDKKEISELDKIIKQARINEKQRIKTEKEIAKQAKLEKKELAEQLLLEKKRIKAQEKELAKQEKLNKKKEKSKKKKNLNIKTSKKKAEITKKTIFASKPSEINFSISDFEKIKQKIINTNITRPYPDINDIPN